MLWYFYIIQLDLAWYGMELCISKKKNKVTDHDKIKYGIMCQNRSFITLIYINYYHNLNKHLVCVSCSSHNKFDCNVLRNTLVLQQKKREMVASAFGEDETGSRQTRLTVDDLKYLFMV